MGLSNIRRKGMWATIAVAIGVINYFAWENHDNFKKMIITLHQQQMLETAKSNASGVEYFIKHLMRELKTASKIPQIQTIAQKGILETDEREKENHLFKTLFKGYDVRVDAFYLLDKNGIILDRVPFKKNKIGTSYLDRPGIKNVINKHEPYVSEIFLTKGGESAVSFLHPLFKDYEFVGILRAVIRIETIFKYFLHKLENAIPGRILLLSDETIHYHLNNEFVSRKIGVLSKEKSQGDERKEGETLRKILSGIDGVANVIVDEFFKGISSVVWSSVSISPTHTTKKLWALVIIEPQSELAELIKRNAINTGVIGGLLILLFSFVGFNLYRVQKGKAVLAAEKEIQRLAAKQWQDTFDAIKDMVTIVDKDLRIVQANQEARNIFPDLVIQNHRYELFHDFQLLPENRVSCDAFETELPLNNEYYDPHSKKWFDSTVYPIKDSEGEIQQLVHILKDITTQKQAIEEKKKLESQLQQSQKMESIGTLAGGIAHDFNNILFPIIGYAEMMLDDFPEDSPHRNDTNTILQGAKRARDLVKQILTFSRQADQELKPLKVQLIIEEVLKLIRSSLPSTIEIKQHISNKCGLIMGDFTQVHQVAMNLMTNAFHAMEDEGGKLEVTLKEIELGLDDLTDPSMTPGTYVCLTVADTGPGMEQSILDRIFDPYFTTKEKDKGTGLGLAVVHGIVKSYKGDIKVYSELGEGTAFHVYLPVIKTQVETEEADAVAPVLKGTERILLVDDEETIVRMETQMLERLGYQVTARTSSPDALEAFRTSPGKFDLVITDMTMPNMTGVQLSQKLLEIRQDIAIIICTGFSEKISEDKAKAIGISGYVMKPVVMKELAKKIREVLDQD